LFDTPDGFFTETCKTPGLWTALDGTVTTIRVAVMLLGTRVSVPKLTTAPVAKLVPKMIRPNDPVPAVIEFVDKLVIVGFEI